MTKKLLYFLIDDSGEAVPTNKISLKDATGQDQAGICIGMKFKRDTSRLQKIV